MRDGDVWAQGINTPLVSAGLILGKIRHAPGARFTSAIGQALVQDWGPLAICDIEALWVGKGLIHLGFAAGAAEILPKFQPKEFFRPAQLDAAGNLNNIAIGKDYHKPRMRLPGSGGNPGCHPLLRSHLSVRAAPFQIEFRGEDRFQQRPGPCAAAARRRRSALLDQRSRPV